jgi:hypothetical protein
MFCEILCIVPFYVGTFYPPITGKCPSGSKLVIRTYISIKCAENRGPNLADGTTQAVTGKDSGSIPPPTTLWPQNTANLHKIRKVGEISRIAHRSE